MNTKDILEKLKLTFAELVKNADVAPVAPVAPEAPEMVTPMKAKLKDGTEVEITALEVGGIVTINGQPAPVGDHTLEDGTVISVGENGAITAVVPTPSMEEEMKKKMFDFEAATNEKFASYETRFADYEAKLSKATKVIEGLLQLTQTLAEQPTGNPDPITNPATKFSAETKTENKYKMLFS